VYQRLFGVDLREYAKEQGKSLPEKWDLSTVSFVHKDMKLADLLKFTWTA